MENIWDAFVTFHVNGASYLYFTFSQNLWYLLIAASAIVCMWLYLREELIVTVREEQQAI